MKLKSLKCPNCDANLEVEDGIDSFFCKYCGSKIMIANQSSEAYKAKVQVKYMEHEEKMKEKEFAQEKYRGEQKKKEEIRSLIGVGCGIGLLLLIVVIISIVGEIKVNNQEKELQSIVEQVMDDLEKGNYQEAYIKAESIYWDDSWSSEETKKWNKIRKEVIEQIKEAEKEEKKSSGGFWDWLG